VASSRGCLFAAEEEASEGLHGVHALVWYTETQAHGRQSRNWFVMSNAPTLLLGTFLGREIGSFCNQYLSAVLPF